MAFERLSFETGIAFLLWSLYLPPTYSTYSASPPRRL